MTGTPVEQGLGAVTPMAVARPLVMLVVGVAAAAAAWHVLMLEPARPGAGDAFRAEQLSRTDRQALHAVLQGSTPASDAAAAR
jgi:hypothetical protein